MDDERLHEAGGYRTRAVDVTRDNAWATLTRYTKSESLLRHALAVEASTRWYARHFGEDEELWGCTALLHDFDYEIHPTLDKHPQDGAPILRDEGYPEVVIEAVLSHAEHLAIPRDTQLKRTLFACDELSGFIHACGLVRPTGLEGLEPKSVRKKLKQPSFAAGVHRDEVYEGAELLGLELDTAHRERRRGAAADRRRARAADAHRLTSLRPATEHARRPAGRRRSGGRHRRRAGGRGVGHPDLGCDLDAGCVGERRDTERDRLALGCVPEDRRPAARAAAATRAVLRDGCTVPGDRRGSSITRSGR